MGARAKTRWAGTLAGLALFLLILGAFGVGYEQMARRRERERFPQIGRSVDIGGRTLNLFCSGQGSPTVVFESDALTPGYSGLVMQRVTARTHRACWYDRAGYGWSDPAPAPHPGTATARDLHSLLRTAGLDPPYLMVGDGFGGFNVRVYASLYPQDVAGIVLVEPIDESAERMGVAGRIPFHLGYPPDLVLRTAGDLGLIRLLPGGRPQTPQPAGWTASEWDTLAGLSRLPKMRAAFLAEQGFAATLEEARSAGNLGDRPLVVIAQAGDQPQESQSSLARLSTRGRAVMVKDRGRHLLYDAPDIVLTEVQKVAAEIRSLKPGN